MSKNTDPAWDGCGGKQRKQLGAFPNLRQNRELLRTVPKRLFGNTVGHSDIRQLQWCGLLGGFEPQVLVGKGLPGSMLIGGRLSHLTSPLQAEAERDPMRSEAKLRSDELRRIGSDRLLEREEELRTAIFGPVDPQKGEGSTATKVGPTCALTSQNLGAEGSEATNFWANLFEHV